MDEYHLLLADDRDVLNEVHHDLEEVDEGGMDELFLYTHQC